MHILIPVLHRPDRPTGVCRHAANLAKCLADTVAVNRVTLITGSWQESYFSKSFNLSSPKIEILGIEIKNSSLSRNSWYLVGLPQLVNRLKPDLVHLSFPLPFLRSRFPCPVVSTLHDLYPYECPENFGFPQVWFNRLFLKQCIHNSDGIACVSNVTLEALETYFGSAIAQKKATVIYNYVDFSETQPQPVQALELEPSTPFLLSVAQHRKNKNLDLLIEAYARLRQENKIALDTQLVVVGSSGPKTDNLRQIIHARSLQKQVHLLSAISDAELCWLYQHCQLFVIPSSTEGFCIPLVEALSLGAKAVCSDLPIFREVGCHSDCRFFCLVEEDANKSVAALEEQITLALAEPHSSDSSNDNRFTKEAVGTDYLDYYHSFL